MPRAIPDMASATWLVSVLSDFKNFFRAGVLKKRLFTSTIVPTGAPASETSLIFPPIISIFVPMSVSLVLVTRQNFDTDAMEGSASPLKPNVEMEKRSSFVNILLVAYRSMDRSASSRLRPCPLSETLMNDFPPFTTSMVIRVDPASILFSTSSFTTDAGLWTTSPAAIWLERISGRILTVVIFHKP